MSRRLRSAGTAEYHGGDPVKIAKHEADRLLALQKAKEMFASPSADRNVQFFPESTDNPSAENEGSIAYSEASCVLQDAHSPKEMRSSPRLGEAGSLQEMMVPEEKSFLDCPVCLASLKPIPVGIDLRKPIKNSSFIRRMRRHYKNEHPHEPIWNAIPLLDLEPSNSAATEPFDNEEKCPRAKNKIASVAGFVSYVLRCAARMHPIPEEQMWSQTWSHVADFLCVRISGACYSVKHNNRPYFKERTSVLLNDCDRAELQGCPLKNQFGWIRKEAFIYLNELLAKFLYAIPAQGWEAESESRRLNRIQTFFYDGAKHRQSGLLAPLDLPHSRHFE
jgi:hypothetical protein